MTSVYWGYSSATVEMATEKRREEKKFNPDFTDYTDWEMGLAVWLVTIWADKTRLFKVLSLMKDAVEMSSRDGVN